MVTIEVTIELLTPLLLGERKRGNVYVTYTHVPGAVLRGAVAQPYIEACPHPDSLNDHVHCPEKCDFYRLFFARPAPRFGPCYPTLARLSYPLPATAQSCKYHPGFAHTPEQHGIQDTLIPLWVFEYLAFEEKKALPEVYDPHCAVCKNEVALEQVSGFWEPAGRNEYYQPRPRISRVSRTAIDRRRGTAAEEMLYTLEMVSEQMDSGRYDENHRPKSSPTRFKGLVWVKEDDADLMKRRLEEITAIGGATSRGLGRVRVTARHVDAPPLLITREDAKSLVAAAAGEIPFEPRHRGHPAEAGLVDRIRAFNRVLWEEFARYAAHAEPPRGSLYFTVNLLSDAILGGVGEPVTLLPQMLAGAERVRAWASHGLVSGWSGALKLPRTVHLAIKAGSVFLYRLRAEDVDAVFTALQELERLEREGLGRERERGYGWVQICLPFHQEVKPK